MQVEPVPGCGHFIVGGAAKFFADLALSFLGVAC